MGRQTTLAARGALLLMRRAEILLAALLMGVAAFAPAVATSAHPASAGEGPRV